MGMGRGGGRGMGRGMGRGYWQATGTFAPQAPVGTSATPPTPLQMSKEQEIQMLENQMKGVQKQLDQIRKRLKELKK
jgi:hypothetical protein